MIHIKMILALVVVLGLSSLAGAAPTELRPHSNAGDPARKMDCSGVQKALEDARVKRDAVDKVDLTACAGKKGPDRTLCVAGKRERAKANMSAARQKVADARKALACCKNSQSKSCSGNRS
jgi:hypothetical protein